jgi:hypothetical protein
MPNINGPILPLQLDPRNTSALVRDMQTKIFLESDGQLNDFSPASPLSALVEGQAFAQAELLYYLNSLPEAYTLQWLRQLGIQRSVGARSVVEVTFIKKRGFNRSVVIPANTIVSTSNNLNFILKDEVRIGDIQSSAKGIVESEKWGGVYNVPAGAIEKINRNILGLERATNLTSSQGGKDLESIDSLKAKAFSLLRRRGLISAEDYENEISLVAPSASIVKVLSYEDKFNVPAEKQSGNIVVCVGDENGDELSVLTRSNIVKSLKSKIPLGNSISLISPEVSPVESTISCEYDDEKFNGGLDLYASQINEIILSTINPGSLPLGEEIDYQSVFNTIYDLSFVDKIKTLAFKILINQPQGTDQAGYCSDLFVSESVDGVCIESSEAYLDSVNTTYKNTNPIRTYRSYKVVVSLIAASTQAPLTYTFINKDYDTALRG